MDEQIWQGWCGLLQHDIALPGMEHYWKLRPELFSARFRRFVETLERPAELHTVGNLLGAGFSKSERPGVDPGPAERDDRTQ